MERLTDCAQGYCEMYCKKYMLCFEDPEDCTFKDEIKLYDAIKSIEGVVPFERLLELACADKAGRLVVLDEPMRPLVWGDKEHDTILCPRCLCDLMGGFEYAPSCETVMFQCPHCGQPINSGKAIDMEQSEAEAAMAQEGGTHEADSV